MLLRPAAAPCPAGLDRPARHSVLAPVHQALSMVLLLALHTTAGPPSATVPFNVILLQASDPGFASSVWLPSKLRQADRRAGWKPRRRQAAPYALLSHFLGSVRSTNALGPLAAITDPTSSQVKTCRRRSTCRRSLHHPVTALQDFVQNKKTPEGLRCRQVGAAEAVRFG